MSSPQLPPTSSPSTPSWTTQLSDSANLLSALKWGVIVAAGYIVLGILLNLLANVIAVGSADITKDPAYLIPSCLSIFVAAFSFYVAGYLPANERGNIATGIVGVVIMLILITLEGIIFGSIQGTSHAGTGPVVVQIIGVIFDLAIGLGIGWVGAFYGVKRRFKVEAKA
jgi:hypothetical protein